MTKESLETTISILERQTLVFKKSWVGSYMGYGRLIEKAVEDLKSKNSDTPVYHSGAKESGLDYEGKI